MPGPALLPLADDQLLVLPHTRANTWKANGRPAPDVFAAEFATVDITADQIVRLDALGEQMWLELQYALQCRADERTSKTSPTVIMQCRSVR